MEFDKCEEEKKRLDVEAQKCKWCSFKAEGLEKVDFVKAVTGWLWRCRCWNKSESVTVR